MWKILQFFKQSQESIFNTILHDSSKILGAVKINGISWQLIWKNFPIKKINMWWATQDTAHMSLFFLLLLEGFFFVFNELSVKLHKKRKIFVWLQAVEYSQLKSIVNISELISSKKKQTKKTKNTQILLRFNLYRIRVVISILCNTRNFYSLMIL